MLKYGKTCQDCAAALHETPWELHFPYENGKEYMVQSLKSLKNSLTMLLFLNVVFVVGGFLLLYFYICKPCIESNY